jgi:hypothetical protein
MSLEGKISNKTQVKKSGLSATHKVRCEKCSTLIDKPEVISIKTNGFYFYCHSYAGTDHYIYDGGRSGKSVCYCSKWCAKKHNHRFRNR